MGQKNLTQPRGATDLGLGVYWSSVRLLQHHSLCPSRPQHASHVSFILRRQEDDLARSSCGGMYTALAGPSGLQRFTVLFATWHPCEDGVCRYSKYVHG